MSGSFSRVFYITPAPAPAAAPAATAPTTTDKPTTTTEKDSGKKKKGKSMTRRQEIEHSVQSGTVPSRYRSQVPKEYQK
jgi:hypothetical protein